MVGCLLWPLTAPHPSAQIVLGPVQMQLFQLRPMHGHTCTEISGTELYPCHEHGHGCATKLPLCPRTKSIAAAGVR